ncbi:MAG TPA: hypothetical protein ENK18_25820, partial [Deltaproteobacteria bacterium]|nr:hypothetical protein [Deltaproteobacteria bacterium]
MTDTLRTARQLLAELQATETYLRVAAARVLPYAGVLGVERRAARRCAELLDGLGIKLGFDPSDLEPVIVVRALPEAPAATQQAQPRQRTSAGPRVRTARTSSAPPSGSGQVRSRTSARGAEGAGPRPRARTLGRGGDDEDITDAATADGPSPYTRRRRSSSRASSVRASSAKASSAKASSAKASSAKASSAKASSAKASSAKASSAKAS